MPIFYTAFIMLNEMSSIGQNGSEDFQRSAEGVVAAYVMGNTLYALEDETERVFKARQQLEALTGSAGDQIVQSLKQLVDWRIVGSSERIDLESFKQELIGYLLRFLGRQP